MAEIFFSYFLVKTSIIRISWKLFLDDHRPPSGQGKHTFNLREDTAAGGPAGRDKINAFLQRHLRNELIEINVAKG